MTSPDSGALSPPGPHVERPLQPQPPQLLLLSLAPGFLRHQHKQVFSEDFLFMNNIKVYHKIFCKRGNKFIFLNFIE